MVVGYWGRVGILGACVVAAHAAERMGDFEQRFVKDLTAYGIARTELQKAAVFAERHLGGLEPDKNGGPALIPREKKLRVWGTWSSILGAQATLDEVRRHWRSRIFAFSRDRQNTAFSINHAAFLSSYRFGLEVIALADRNPVLDKILNEPVPELGLPAGTFDRYKARFLNVSLATEFSALRVVDRAIIRTHPALSPAIAEDSQFIWDMGKGKGHELTFKGAVSALKKTGFAAWFPIQKGVSDWMGDTKVWRIKKHLIAESQIESARSRLEPGDILFERHEWYLSNLGLPGFWTHAALYVGTADERRAFFQDPEVLAWVKSQGVPEGDLETLLRTRYPVAYARSTQAQEEGHVPRILEAISEGVSFTSLERSGASDSLAVIRPSLDKREKAQAILRAFHYSGRPYDFNFDFETDATLVCSELIYKAYEPGQGMRGLVFPVTEVMGRKVSPPNEMVRQFSEEGHTQSRFVLFFDGYEKERRAVESTEAQFRTSWKRPNWHILVQAPPQAVLTQGGTPQP